MAMVFTSDKCVRVQRSAWPITYSIGFIEFVSQNWTSPGSKLALLKFKADTAVWVENLVEKTFYGDDINGKKDTYLAIQSKLIDASQKKLSSLLVSPDAQVADSFKAIVGNNVVITNTVLSSNQVSDISVVQNAIVPGAITLYINASQASVDNAIKILKIRDTVKSIDSLSVYNLDLSCPK